MTLKIFNDNVKDTLLGTTNSHKWWSTFKSALFGVDMSVPPLLKTDGTVTHCPKEKANLFPDIFDEKQSNEKLSMPQTCHPDAKLTTLAFWSHEVCDFLLDLDAYGGAGPDGVFPLFFFKTAHFLAQKISTIFRKLVRDGKFSTC